MVSIAPTRDPEKNFSEESRGWQAHIRIGGERVGEKVFTVKLGAAPDDPAEAVAALKGFAVELDIAMREIMNTDLDVSWKGQNEKESEPRE